MAHEMLNNQGVTRDEVKDYLDDLRESGETNVRGGGLPPAGVRILEARESRGTEPLDGGVREMRVSTDGGMTWVKMDEVRIIHDLEDSQLLTTVTHEGLVHDVLGHVDGEALGGVEVTATSCWALDDIVGQAR